MTELEPPKGVGFIVRTAAIDRNTEELQGDLMYLLKLWQVVVKRIKKMPSPVEIYRESDIITRTIRDTFKSDIDTIYVDEPVAFQQASEFMQIVMPRFADRIKLYEGGEPLFHRYKVEDEIVKINQKRIEMPRGGSIIIEQTEALVAIDVNSGNFRADNNAEETAYQMNLLAAKEIARQLRLRDLGGVIVNDFIDMRSESHRRHVEDTLRDALLRDKARTKILRISQFGIIEMTRQRMQPSLKKRIFNECPHCKATGHVKNAESMGIDVMRTLQLAAHKAPPVQSVQVAIHDDVAQHLLNKKRRDVAQLEEKAQIEITITGLTGVSPEHLEMKCFDGNGTEVKMGGGPPMKLGAAEPREERGRGRRR
jgi:ribonuclease E